MLPSDPIAEAIGLIGYASNAPGIGGLLKVRTSDFRVEEVATSLALDPKGRFTVARITLTNWETNRFCQQLANRLRIPRNRIFFAGTKDKRAITSQIFVIDAHQSKVADIEMSDVEIEILGRTHQKIGFGNHRGNRFTIVVRGCADEEGNPLSNEGALERISTIVEEMSMRVGAEKFPNWIGPQRFGSGRPVTAATGYYALQGDWENAVMTYLTMPGEEDEDAAVVRMRILEEGISEGLIEDMPKWMGYERRMIEHLLKNDGDFLGAFSTLPSNLQLMTIHSVQSKIFNTSMKNRLALCVSLSEPQIGDLVGRIDEKGQLEVSSCVEVKPKTQPRISRNCSMGRLVTTGPLPGCELSYAHGDIGSLEESAAEELGLSSLDWVISDIPALTTSGTRRALVTTFEEFQYETVPIAENAIEESNKSEKTKENQTWHEEGACIRFRFTLPPGSYATILLREFMKSPTNHL